VAELGVAPTPLNRMSTAEHVASTLREQLLERRFSPGSRLPEDEIAAAMQVSRNSVREGLQILAAEGLVQRSLHRGAVVAELDGAALEDVYRARRIVEIGSLRAGAAAAPDSWVEGVGAALRLMEAAAAAESVPELLEADRLFHESIVAGARSERIGRFYRNLQTEIRLTRSWQDEREPSSIFVARHRDVAEAIQQRDFADAERLLSEIIDAGEDRVRKSLATMPGHGVDGEFTG
jgi:DNA-binding GntR family transcriptional regulator